MNQNIKLLAEQARRKPMGNSWTYRSYSEFEKNFADLLLYECIKLAVFRGDKETAKAIKEHFGVQQWMPK